MVPRSLLSLLLAAACAAPAALAEPPHDWRAAIASFDLLYTADEAAVKPDHMPAVANGYLGVQLGGVNMYVAGLMNGHATNTPSRRARIPATLNVAAPGTLLHAGLDLARATYIRRSTVKGWEGRGPAYHPCNLDWYHLVDSGSCSSTGSPLVVEQRFYAHRVLRSALVMEVEALGEKAAVEAADADASAGKAGAVSGDRLRGPSVYVLPDEAESYASAFLQRLPGLSDLPISILQLTNVPGPRSEDLETWEDVTERVAGAGNWLVSDLIERRVVRVLLGRTKEPETPDVGGPATVVVVTSVFPTPRAKEAAGSKLSIYEQAATEPGVNYASDAARTGKVILRHAGDVHAFITVVKTSHDVPAKDLKEALDAGAPAPGDFSMVEAMAIAAALTDFEAAMELQRLGALHASHVEAWRKLWRSQIDVTMAPAGDAAARHGASSPALPAILKSSLYSLLSYVRPDWPFGSSPGGLSTVGYGGRQFWDTDSFMLPVMMLFHRRHVESVLQYRLHRLPGARQKARSYPDGGYRGAMWPWESGFAGVEACPRGYPTGEKEIHVSGDVAVSVWQYWQVTRDLPSGWLRDVAFPILAETADFWVSRALADTPGATVRGWSDALRGAGVPADVEVEAAGSGTAPGWAEAARAALLRAHERGLPSAAGAPPLGGAATRARALLAAAANGTSASRRHSAPNDDSAATSALHIRKVIPPTEFYNDVDDSVFTNAVAKLALEAAVAAAQELRLPRWVYAAWEDAAERVVIPFDADKGVHPYFAGFEWKEEGAGQVQLLDALMLWWPLLVTDASPLAPAFSMTRDTFLADLAYYTSHQEASGSVAFSWAVNAIMWAEGRNQPRADEFFAKTFRDFLFGPFQVWMEGAGGWGTPNFVTGAGALLEAAVFGYARARINDTCLALVDPWLLPGTSAVHLRGVEYLGSKLSLSYGKLGAGGFMSAAEAGAAAPSMLASAVAADVLFRPGSIAISVAALEDDEEDSIVDLAESPLSPPLRNVLPVLRSAGVIPEQRPVGYLATALSSEAAAYLSAGGPLLDDLTRAAPASGAAQRSASRRAARAALRGRFDTLLAEFDNRELGAGGAQARPWSPVAPSSRPSLGPGVPSHNPLRSEARSGHDAAEEASGELHRTSPPLRPQSLRLGQLPRQRARAIALGLASDDVPRDPAIAELFGYAPAPGAAAGAEEGGAGDDGEEEGKVAGLGLPVVGGEEDPRHPDATVASVFSHKPWLGVSRYRVTPRELQLLVIYNPALEPEGVTPVLRQRRVFSVPLQRGGGPVVVPAGPAWELAVLEDGGEP